MTCGINARRLFKKQPAEPRDGLFQHPGRVEMDREAAPEGQGGRNADEGATPLSDR